MSMTPELQTPESLVKMDQAILPDLGSVLGDVTGSGQVLETHKEQEAAKEPGRKRVFMMACACFVLLNIALTFFAPIKFDEYKFPYRGWAWWTMNDLKRGKADHNIALLGSSLMVSVIAGADANHLNKNLDLTSYHKASYLDDQLRARFPGSFNTFNLSAPGQMPSDAYLALRAMVNTANRPDVVIYGVAPRDFIDSTLSSPASTEPFKYLKRFVNIDDVAFAVFRDPFARLDWLMQRSIYLYGSSLDFQLAFNDFATEFLQTAVPRPYNNPRFTWWDRVRLMPQYLPGEIHPEAVMAGPIDRKTADERYSDNTKEYQDRYRSPDPHTYKTQIYFLKRLAKFCHQERIELVLVNMPITLYNVGMLQPGVYMKYLQAMRELAVEANMPFYDLANFAMYQRNDFHDSVHLNAFGGRKFLDDLVNRLANDGRCRGAFILAGQQLDRNKSIAASRRSRDL